MPRGCGYLCRAVFLFCIMAENKKTFIFYSDWINIVNEMPDSDAGQLLKHILAYVNDKNPETINPLVKLAFGHMKPMLKADLIKWSGIRERRKEFGKKGGLAKAKQKLANGKQLVAVNDNVNVTSNVLLKKEPKEGINFSGLLGCINSAFSKKLKVINATTQKKFNARLKDGYSKDDIFNAITNASHDEFHKESNFKWCTPEYFSRSTTLDKYGFESQPVKAEKLIVPHYNENYPANLGDGTPA